MGPTPVYGARAEKPLQNADFAMKQTNICRLSERILKIGQYLTKLCVDNVGLLFGPPCIYVNIVNITTFDSSWLFRDIFFCLCTQLTHYVECILTKCISFSVTIDEDLVLFIGNSGHCSYRSLELNRRLQ